MSSYQAALDGAALFNVSDRGKIEFEGPDAPSFLHNLSTNDINNLPLGGGCEAFFTTAKAKIIGRSLIFHAMRSDGQHTLWLDTDPGQSQNLVQHLGRFQIAEQLEMFDKTADYCQFHLAGPRAAEVLSQALGQPVPPLEPLMHMERTFGNDLTCSIRRVDALGVPGFDILCARDRMDAVRARLLAAGAEEGTPADYEVLRVEAGTPIVGRDLDENRFVVEVGRANAICYSKGCYLGQEPIVMARDRAGHVNRSFRGLKLPNLVPPGTKLFAGDKEVGTTASSVMSPRLGPVALAFVRRGSDESGTRLRVGESGSAAEAEVLALPMKPSA